LSGFRLSIVPFEKEVWTLAAFQAAGSKKLEEALRNLEEARIGGSRFDEIRDFIVRTQGYQTVRNVSNNVKQTNEQREKLQRFLQGKSMKIKVESEKIVKAVKKLEGIEMVLENAEDASEALNLILRRTDLLKVEDLAKLIEVKVSSFQEYKTSAVDYTMVFLLEFSFRPDMSAESKVAVIKALQEFFTKI